MLNLWISSTKFVNIFYKSCEYLLQKFVNTFYKNLWIPSTKICEYILQKFVNTFYKKFWISSTKICEYLLQILWIPFTKICEYLLQKFVNTFYKNSYYFNMSCDIYLCFCNRLKSNTDISRYLKRRSLLPTYMWRRHSTFTTYHSHSLMLISFFCLTLNTSLSQLQKPLTSRDHKHPQVLTGKRSVISVIFCNKPKCVDNFFF
jgi:hypothetical protein